MNKPIVPTVLIFFGPPGSGKGEAAGKLSKLGFRHLSTSGLLTKKAENDPAFAARYNIGQNIRGASPCPDSAVLAVLQQALKEHPTHNAIIDGTPRTVLQVTAVIELLRNLKFHFIFLRFECSREICDYRIQQSRIPATEEAGLVVREDDRDPKKRERRFDQYHATLDGIVNEIAQHGQTVHVVDASGTPDEVLSQIIKIAIQQAPS